MTIEKGRAWGRPGSAPPGTPVAVDDADLATMALAAHRRGETLQARLTGGDLLATLGVTPGAGPIGQEFCVDLGVASADDGPEIPFVAHLVARRRFWAGEFAVVMNGGWLGDRYLGPRAHPNDGRLDITLGSLPPRQRLLAARRARTGSHLPHPRLTTARRAEWHHTFERSVALLADGTPAGRASSLRVRAIPDCLTLFV